MQQKIDTLQTENKDLISETYSVKIQNDTIAALKREVADKSKLIFSLNREKEDSIKQRVILERKTSEIELLNAQVERNDIEKKALQDVKVVLVQKEHACARLNDEVGRLTEENNKLSEELNIARRELLEMQEQERNRTTTHELENQKLQTLQKESYERISHAYRKAQADWSNAEKEYEDAIAHNDEEMRSLNATVTTLRAELQQSNYIRESANERCQQLETEINKLQDSITRLKDENEKATFNRDEKHRKELDEKHEVLIEMQTKHYEAVGKIKTLESSLNNEKQIRIEQQEHLEKLLRNSAADATKMKDKHEELQVAYTHAQINWATEKGNLEGQIKLLNNKIDMMTAALVDAKEGTNTAQQTSEEMRNRAEAWKKEQSRLKTELRELNKKYDSVSMEK